jgi:glycine/D-amino acid oxidase-like deaminating enzyme
LGDYLQTKLIHKKDIIDFFPSAQMRDAFVNRITEDDTFLHPYPDQNHFNQFFHYDFGCGAIKPVLLVSTSLLLASWHYKLAELHALVTEQFDNTELEVETESVRYKNITAQKVIFCDGVNSLENPWFGLLPFSAVKGEALIIESTELTNEHIFKKGLLLAPMPVQHHYWVGSNYTWEFENDQPTDAFYQQTVAHLKHWLKVPFEVLFHKAAVRPATLERRPFVGFHPHQPSVGILNGMGTKGTSLAPFFAYHLTQHLVHGFPLMPEVAVERFAKILAK